jgi:hypothetical protein
VFVIIDVEPRPKFSDPVRVIPRPGAGDNGLNPNVDVRSEGAPEGVIGLLPSVRVGDDDAAGCDACVEVVPDPVAQNGGWLMYS